MWKIILLIQLLHLASTNFTPPYDPGSLSDGSQELLPQVTCSDPRMRVAWSLIEEGIRNDATLERAETPQLKDCSHFIEIANVDLNDDGENEILMRGKRIPFCGMTGSCSFYVFQRRNKEFARIMLGSIASNQSIERSITEKYRRGFRILSLTDYQGADEVV